MGEKTLMMTADFWLILFIIHFRADSRHKFANDDVPFMGFG